MKTDELKTFFSGRPTADITKAILGKRLSYQSPQGLLSGIIVEAEAYLGQEDSTAHAFNGRRTPANEALYGEPGTIYIYTLRGQYMFDVAVQEKDNPQGILVRGLEPVDGIDLMTENRQGKTGSDISNGPGKLMQALGIQSKALNLTMVNAGPLSIDLEHGRQPKEIVTSARVGVSKRGDWTEAPYRFYVAGNPYVSGMRKRDMDLDSHGWLN